MKQAIKGWPAAVNKVAVGGMDRKLVERAGGSGCAHRAPPRAARARRSGAEPALPARALPRAADVRLLSPDKNKAEIGQMLLEMGIKCSGFNGMRPGLQLCGWEQSSAPCADGLL